MCDEGKAPRFAELSADERTRAVEGRFLKAKIRPLFRADLKGLGPEWWRTYDSWLLAV